MMTGICFIRYVKLWTVSGIISKNGTRSGVYENPMLDIQIMNLFIFLWKLYQINVSPWIHSGFIGFLTHMQCLKCFLTTPLSWDYLKTIPYLFCRKWCQFIVWPWTNGGHLGFLPTMQCLTYFLATPLCTAYPKIPWWTLKPRICLYYSENDMNLLFDLEQMAVILVFHPQCNVWNIFWQHHYVRHTWNPMINTKTTNLPLLWRKWYKFIVWPWTNGGHLGFFPTM